MYCKSFRAASSARLQRAGKQFILRGRIDSPIRQWQVDGWAFWQQLDALVETLDGLVEVGDAE